MAETNPTSSVNSPKPLSRALKTFFGVGDMTFTFMTNLESYYFMFFLTDIAKFAPALIASITSIASMVDMALSWVYGGILSGLKARKWGRYRSYLIMIPWIVPFLYAFQYMKIGNNDNVAAIIIIAGSITSHILWNTAYVANVTLISVVGKTPEDKAIMSSNRGAAQSLSGILFSYIGLPLTTVLGGVVGQANRFAAGAFCLAAAFAIGYFIHFKMTEGYEDSESSEAAAAAAVKNKVSVPDMFRALFQNSQLLILIVAYTVWCIYQFVFAGTAVYYWRIVAGDVNLNNTFILFTSIGSIIGAISARQVVKMLSARTTMLIGCFLSGIFLSAIAFVYTSPMVVMTVSVIGRFFTGFSNATFVVLFSDTIIYATWKTGKNAAGWIMGLMNLPVKVAVFLRGLIITGALAAIGYSAKLTPAQFTPQLKQGLAMTFGLIPGISLLVSGLIILLAFKLTKAKVAQYQAEIDNRA